MLGKFKRGFGRRGDMAIWEIVTIVIVVLVLVLSIVFVFILREKGFEGALGTIKDLFRFGRPR